MTLVKCDECGKAISDKAMTCPDCGATNKKWRDPSKLFGMGRLGWLGLLLLIGLVFGGRSNTGTPSAVAPQQPQKVGNILVEPGRLRDDWPKAESCATFNVKLASGVTPERDKDIEELAKDWAFYRKKILECHNDGDAAGENKARASFNKVNYWLDQYNRDDVSFALDKWGM